MLSQMPVTHDWKFVDAQLRSLARDRAVRDAHEAKWLREGDRLRIWREVGQPSMLAYLEQVLGYAPRTAFDRMRVARALGRLPNLEAALAAGTLSYCAVRELTRVVAPETEQRWLEEATGRPLREVEEMVRGHAPGDRPDDPTNPELETYKVTLELSPSAYALLRQARQLLKNERDESVDDSELVRALCVALMDGSGNRARALNQIAITICDNCKRGWQDAGGKAIELEPKAVEKATCDAEHIGSLDAKKPARAVQDVPPATCRLVMRRDRGRCRIPGCRSANLKLPIPSN